VVSFAVVFAFSAGTALFMQFKEDIETLLVDSKKNLVMLGFVSGLALASSLIWETLGLGLFIAVLAPKMRLGEGDSEVLRWLFPGTMLLGSLAYSAFFLLALLLAFLVYEFWRRKQVEQKDFPCMILIMAAFLATIDFYLLIPI
jgi:hypothetical protein